MHQWRQYTPHRPSRQRRVARHLNRDRMAGDDTHHQARAGAGITEFERALRLVKSARSAAFDFPDVPVLCRRSPECGDSARRIDNVLGLQQTANTGPFRSPAPRKSAPGARSTCRPAREADPGAEAHALPTKVSRSKFSKVAIQGCTGAEIARPAGSKLGDRGPGREALSTPPRRRRQGGLDAAGEGTPFRFDRPHSVWQTGSLILRIIRGSV